MKQSQFSGLRNGRSSSALTERQQALIPGSGGSTRLIGEDSRGACCVTMQGLWKPRLGLGIDVESTLLSDIPVLHKLSQRSSRLMNTRAEAASEN